MNSKLTFERVVARNRAVMPEFMREYDAELKACEPPLPGLTTKRNYITAWLNFYDPELIKNTNADELLVQYSVDALEIAFLWVQNHFAELDLGGGFKWSACARDILNLLEAGRWNTETEFDLYLKYVRDTRWADEL